MKESKFTVLIAEDDEISFELYRIRLEQFDLNLLHATDGQKAVNFAKENPQIQLILMDIRMPVLNGYEATEKIREFNKTVPIIAQTAFAMIPEQKIILQSGFTDFLSKPIEEERLVNLIWKYMKTESSA
ncbi:MAG: response regulator [Bacteroidales bacterium]|nr:response regulator [Bacteroidales bacterium]